MSGDARPADWLYEQLMASPAAVTAASRVLAAGGRSNDASLRARRDLEYTLGLSGTGAGDYLDAATRMEDAGFPAHAETLRAIAATQPELDAARCRWAARRLQRPVSPVEAITAGWVQDGVLLTAGPSQPGADGCYYGLSRIQGGLGLPGSEWAVMMLTSDSRPRVVAGFDDEQHARAWMADRVYAGPRPLAACLIGPDCRASREERLLAGLLPQPASTLGDVPVSTALWSSDLRAEIFLAWQATAPSSRTGPEPEAVAAALERRMLRAPADAFAGPPGQMAQAYLRRLTATKVTRDSALAAARDVIAEDRRAAVYSQDRTTVPDDLAKQAGHAAAAVARPLQDKPPGPAHRQPGQVPRH